MLLAVLCLVQLYGDYIGPDGFMTVVSLARLGLDSLHTIVAICTIRMWAYNIHFSPTLCRCISVSTTLYLSMSVGATGGIASTMVLLELYEPTFGDIPMSADDHCFFHCFNYCLSNGKAELTETSAMRLRMKVMAQLKRDSQPERV